MARRLRRRLAQLRPRRDRRALLRRRLLPPTSRSTSRCSAPTPSPTPGSRTRTSRAPGRPRIAPPSSRAPRRSSPARRATPTARCSRTSGSSSSTTPLRARASSSGTCGTRRSDPRRGGLLLLVPPHPLPHGIVGHAVLPPHRRPARLRDLTQQPLVARPLHLSAPASPPRRFRTRNPPSEQCRCPAPCRLERHCAKSSTHEQDVAPGWVEGRGAVRVDDLKVLQPVVIGDAADVVEDQGHPADRCHGLTLTAELAPAASDLAAYKRSFRCAVGSRLDLRREFRRGPQPTATSEGHGSKWSTGSAGG